MYSLTGQLYGRGHLLCCPYSLSSSNFRTPSNIPIKDMYKYRQRWNMAMFPLGNLSHIRPRNVLTASKFSLSLFNIPKLNFELFFSLFCYIPLNFANFSLQMGERSSHLLRSVLLRSAWLQFAGRDSHKLFCTALQPGDSVWDPYSSCNANGIIIVS